MEVAQFGPRELWVVSEGDWSLPVYCDPYTADGRTHTHWSVRPAVQLLATPHTELSKRFAPLNLGTSSLFWVIEVGRLEKLARKAGGCVAKDYLKWSSEAAGKEMFGKEEIKDVNDKDNEFLKYLCKRSGIDLVLGRYFMHALKGAMQNWFIQVQKPIDFELFSVVPLPYRWNWKEIMLSKHMGCHEIFRKKRHLWRDLLVKIGFIQNLGSTDLLAMDRKIFTWTLELVPGKLWDDSVREAETTRLATKQPLKYARYYESVLRRRLDDILTAFHAWMAQISRPVGGLRDSLNGSGQILVSVTKRRKVFENRYRPPVTYFQPPDGKPTLIDGQGGEQRCLSKTAKQMFMLPSVQPPDGDLREFVGSGDVEEPGHGTNGACGVLLPDENESPASGSRLLAGGKTIEL